MVERARTDLPKAELFDQLGYGDAIEQVEALLQAEGLSRPSRPNIHVDKVPRVEALLAERFLLHCERGDCLRDAPALAAGRTLARASRPEACEVCGGSVSQRAIDQMVDACRSRGWRRIAVVGGSPNARESFRAGVGERLELRLIGGTGRRTHAAAAADLAWADWIVIWGGTLLDHGVSQLYTGGQVSSVGRRSIQAVCEEVERVARGARKGRRRR